MAEKEVTKELINDLIENPDKIDQLDSDLRDKVIQTLHGGDGSLDFSTETSEDEGGEEGGDKKEDKTDGEQKDTTTKPVKTKKSEWQERLERIEAEEKDLLSRAEKIKKRREDYQKRFETETKDLKIDDPDDADFTDQIKELKEGYLKLQKRNDLLEQEIFSRYDEEHESISSQAKTARQKGIFSEIEELQSEYAGQLKTKAPFEKLNHDYTKYLDSLVKVAGLNSDEYKGKSIEEKRDMAYDMFEDDPVFRKQAKDAGVELPKSLQDEDDYKRYELITSLHASKTKSGGSLKANFLEWLDKNGKLEEAFNEERKKAALDASRRTAESLTEHSIKEPSPNDGPGTDGKPEGLNKSNLKQRLDFLESKLSRSKLKAEEEQEMDQILAILAGEGT